MLGLPSVAREERMLEAEARYLAARHRALFGVALTGTGAELLDNPHVKQAYLGA